MRPWSHLTQVPIVTTLGSYRPFGSCSFGRIVARVTEKPRHTESIADCSVRVTPLTLLQGVDHLPAHGELTEPAVKHVRHSETKQREHHSVHADGSIASRDIRTKEVDRTGQDAVGDGVARPVIPPEVSEGVERQFTAEHLLIEAKGVRCDAREVQIWDGSGHLARLARAPYGCPDAAEDLNPPRRQSGRRIMTQ